MNESFLHMRIRVVILDGLLNRIGECGWNGCASVVGKGMLTNTIHIKAMIGLRLNIEPL